MSCPEQDSPVLIAASSVRPAGEWHSKASAAAHREKFLALPTRPSIHRRARSPALISRSRSADRRRSSVACWRVTGWLFADGKRPARPDETDGLAREGDASRSRIASDTDPTVSRAQRAGRRGGGGLAVSRRVHGGGVAIGACSAARARGLLPRPASRPRASSRPDRDCSSTNWPSGCLFVGQLRHGWCWH